jgi:hypothetical protein
VTGRTRPWIAWFRWSRPTGSSTHPSRSRRPWTCGCHRPSTVELDDGDRAHRRPRQQQSRRYHQGPGAADRPLNFLAQLLHISWHRNAAPQVAQDKAGGCGGRWRCRGGAFTLIAAVLMPVRAVSMVERARSRSDATKERR